MRPRAMEYRWIYKIEKERKKERKQERKKERKKEREREREQERRKDLDIVGLEINALRSRYLCMRLIVGTSV